MEGVIGLVFLCSLIYGIWRSQRRYKTVLYAFLATVVGCAIYMVAGYFIGLSGYAGGYIGIQVGLLCGALSALVHSRRTQTAVVAFIDKNR